MDSKIMDLCILNNKKKCTHCLHCETIKQVEETNDRLLNLWNTVIEIAEPKSYSNT